MFWKKTVRVTHNEIELETELPYIVSKFEPFLGSRAIRTIVGQPLTTLDFGAFMDDGRAVLISLAKKELLEQTSVAFLASRCFNRSRSLPAWAGHEC